VAVMLPGLTDGLPEIIDTDETNREAKTKGSFWGSLCIGMALAVHREARHVVEWHAQDKNGQKRWFILYKWSTEMGL
jgi:hypothetical protein